MSASSSLLELEQLTPDYLWNTLHVKSGNTLLASQLATSILETLRTDDFKFTKNAERHGEIARIAEQTQMASFKHASNWPDAKPHLVGAGKTILDHYPVGQTQAEAEQRTDYWQPVYNQKAARIVARDAADLFRNLDQLVDRPTLLAMAVAIEGMLNQLEPERFDLINQIKNGSYAKAQLAYDSFMEKHGFEGQENSVDQIITVTSIMIGRAVDQADTHLIAIGLNTLRVAFFRQPQLGRFIIQELKKNISQQRRQTELNRKLNRWSTDAEQDSDVLKLISNFESLTHIGLGKDDIRQLR